MEHHVGGDSENFVALFFVRSFSPSFAGVLLALLLVLYDLVAQYSEETGLAVVSGLKLLLKPLLDIFLEILCHSNHGLSWVFPFDWESI